MALRGISLFRSDHRAAILAVTDIPPDGLRADRSRHRLPIGLSDTADRKISGVSAFFPRRDIFATNNLPPLNLATLSIGLRPLRE